MKICVLGGDGYCGWAAALYLSARGHQVSIVDSLVRRQWDRDLEVETLTPILSMPERLNLWRQMTDKTIRFFPGDVTDYEFLSGAIRALDSTTGKLRWEFKLHTPPWSGVLSTAGGLVFSGSDEGNFYALDASTGKPLLDFQTGGSIAANPIAFTIDGQQRIAISADRVLYVFGL